MESTNILQEIISPSDIKCSYSIQILHIHIKVVTVIIHSLTKWVISIDEHQYYNRFVVKVVFFKIPVFNESQKIKLSVGPVFLLCTEIWHACTACLVEEILL